MGREEIHMYGKKNIHAKWTFVDKFFSLIVNVLGRGKNNLFMIRIGKLKKKSLTQILRLISV
jgi:hypothetical protein